jgi:hypothetical protein
MKWGCRFLPFEQLEQRYLRDKSSFFGGLWFPAEYVIDFEPVDLLRILGLNYTLPNGGPACSDGNLGAIQFPITPDIWTATSPVQSHEFGGRLPTASIGATANGFAPGPLLIPEFILAQVEVPQESKLVQVLPGGECKILARWKYRQWNSQ